MLPVFSRLSVCGLLLTTLLAGCDAMEKAREAAKRSQVSIQLKQLGQAYRECHDQVSRGPQNWQEAGQKGGLASDVQSQLESAGYTVHWGIRMSDVVGGTATFIVAYPPNAATEGGSILMLDGAVLQMSAQEFNDALAKQKADEPKAMAAGQGGKDSGATGDASGGISPSSDSTGTPGASPPTP